MKMWMVDENKSNIRIDIKFFLLSIKKFFFGDRTQPSGTILIKTTWQNIE